MNYFLSTKSIELAYKVLTELDVSYASVLHIFMILKGCNYNSIDFQPIVNISEFGFDKAARISLLFSPEETLPLRYDFINPFEMKGWHAQSPSEPLKKWVSARIKNNILGGAITWRKIILEDPDVGQFKFSYNYINEVKALTLKEQKVSLIAISIWANRFTMFDRKVTSKELINEFCKRFNLLDEETGTLFHTKVESNEISFDNKIHNTSLIRHLIGNPKSEENWVRSDSQNPDQLKTTFISNYTFMPNNESKKIDPNFILEVLNDYKQVILSGPPATSKSFLANEVGKNFKNIWKIQFHPQYSYQEFIGGYIVNKTEVEYRSGVLLDIINFLKESPNEKGLLVIDEINRANISQVFGEVIQCLDRGYEVDIKINDKNDKLSLPDNLFVLGTMNSSDRTIGAIDHAVRRRFLNVYCAPNVDLLLDYCESEGDFSLYDFLTKINKSIYSVLKNRELVLGHAIFFNEAERNDGKFKWTFEKLEVLFNFKILPTLEEYCYGDEVKVKDIIGEKLPLRLTGQLFIEAIKEYTLL